MQAVEIADGIYWVGALDWNAREFHGFATLRGTSYNSYLILDERNVLIDCVKTPFLGEMMARIRSVIDPKEIDLIVSNHAEGDHASGLPLTQQITGAEILATKKGLEALRLNYGEMRMREVADGEELSIGRRTLRFIETPMVHWPESMFTYAVEDQILFSMDAFGQHYCSSQRYDDQVDLGTLMEEAATYYANIVLPFGAQVKKAYAKVKELPIKLLATSHGLMWRTHIKDIVEAYVGWADHRTEERVLVIFDTMWGSTERMAEAITEGVRSQGVPVTLMRLTDTDRSMVMREVLRSRIVAVGSCTMNNGMFPTVADITTYMRGLRPKDRRAAVFGSYGWGGGASKAIRENLEAAGFELPFPDLDIRYAPMKEGVERCIAYGVELAKSIKS
ncbi:MAG: Type A flavoprotein FprA [Methanomassiliicoccales archaeon PtaB.Bin134]|nr:MAG: Type A flavoprotein FprA [Methanomassiliicoccales archaeon PtaB.Bin134]